MGGGEHTAGAEEPDRISKLIQKIKKMDRKTRVQVCIKFLEKTIEASGDTPMEKLMAIAESLASEEGAVIYPHMWKKKYRNIMIDILYNALLVYARSMPVIISSIIGEGRKTIKPSNDKH